ncbi:MAG: hypothetical protein IT367_03180 [Candidatus Hydrogenedentes bacterium]|nr:hypothetical protein [Candidatus Hydrogenedentota bacterium]
MSETPLQLPEYGDSGDFIGARRTRRSFRWGVALVVLFTVLLWVTESFWRYAPAERLYRSSLTMLPNQGRNLLRQAVKYDAKSETPSSKYYEALAEREEEDLVVSAYENASKLDPQNADLAIKFGCQLFKLGLYTRAREQFRLAAESGAHNALAVYLEASVLPQLNSSDPDVDIALALTQQANSSGDEVIFPEPMWFSSVSRSGQWYAQLRREMVQFCGAPLEEFAKSVLAASEKELVSEQSADSVANLQTFHTMGLRVVLGALHKDSGKEALGGGAPQLYLGLRLMSLALEQQKRVAAATGAKQEESAGALAEKLSASLQTIEQFEKERQITIDTERRKYGAPWILVEYSILITLVCFSTAYILSKILRVQGASHSVRHSSLTRAAWAFQAAVQLFLLLFVAALQRTSHGDLPGQGIVTGCWYLLLAAVLLISIVAPALHLPSPETVLQRLPAERRGELPGVRARYRAAYVSLVKRNLGVQFGITLCVLCIWIIAYRIAVGAYPWMMTLLITGMEEEELALVRSIIATLG